MTREYFGKNKITNESYSGIADASQTLGKRNFASEAQVIAERNDADFDTPVWNMYGWTRGMRLIPKGDRPRLIARDSILLNPNIAQQAVAANRSGNLYYPDSEVYNTHLEIAKTDKDKLPEKRRVLLVPKAGNITIAHGEDEALRFLAQGKNAAKTYLSRVGEKDINTLTVYMPSADWVEQNADDTFVQQSWLVDLADVSSFLGYGRDFHFHNGAFGVFPTPQGAHKNPHVVGKDKKSEPLPYTNRQLDAATKVVANVREGKVGTSKLEKAFNFLQKLPRKK